VYNIHAKPHNTTFKNKINPQTKSMHPLFEIQNKLGTMMPWMTSDANTGGQKKLTRAMQ
jgi:hypothetical protein